MPDDDSSVGSWNSNYSGYLTIKNSSGLAIRPGTISTPLFYNYNSLEFRMRVLTKAYC
jgi:hypothetical protein